ncbi:MAG TPA: rhodanese-like domain-containing protein [bacterium]|nr:rhodanese-like domain-containing protein [bacterium]HMW37641.1 rhodanese-like domain-containing protein [bacterium]HMY35654.1 rhodanese-like domain-containing protein [bacterium]HMZ05112.1 rhodanese-like domain-containing protein [bacterium]HNC50276.1 rhodanese-like domain-containing protein [bacterium]
MNHSPGFLKVVNDSKTRVREISVQQCLDDIQKNPAIALIDVREESEYAAGHVSGAEHIGRGIIERDIETKHPDHDQVLYLYCGGGFRSALAADNLQKMGYTRVYSVAGGWRAFLDIQAPVEKP